MKRWYLHFVEGRSRMDENDPWSRLNLRGHPCVICRIADGGIELKGRTREQAREYAIQCEAMGNPAFRRSITLIPCHIHRTRNMDTLKWVYDCGCTVIWSEDMKQTYVLELAKRERCSIAAVLCGRRYLVFPNGEMLFGYIV